ncbi:type ISP restriction/modification enzyme [Borreliella garinii]|uniref:type ISP restriction/modification enzyme n=1 Tax=Borreliella garinii TaxID=29519 RepID=UPI00226CA29E|nr:type ISP restriction/modification enzyme [Borreliella garinii]
MQVYPKKTLEKKYGIKTDSRLCKLVKVQEFLKNTNTNIDPNYVMEMSYRPFDNRFTYYSKNKGIIIRPSYRIMKHIIEIHKNIALMATRIFETDNFCHAFISSKISESSIIRHRYVFPLYIIEDPEMLERYQKENFKKI